MDAHKIFFYAIEYILESFGSYMSMATMMNGDAFFHIIPMISFRTSSPLFPLLNNATHFHFISIVQCSSKTSYTVKSLFEENNSIDIHLFLLKYNFLMLFLC